MGNFLVLASASHLQQRAHQLFELGTTISRTTKGQTPQLPWIFSGVHAVAFDRRARPEASFLTTDPATGAWLLATGTWFHSAGYAAGEEDRLLERYLEVGATRLASELEGFFLIVAGEPRREETVVITDLVGSCHGFVRDFQGVTALSGSSFVLAALERIDLDPIGVQEFLNTGIVYEDRTLYSQVRKLPPATVLHFAQGRLRQSHRYWSIRDLTADSIDAEAAPKILAERLSEAAGKIGRRFARPVCDLTGGYDSRSILAGFLMAGVRFSTTVSGPGDSADVVVSKGLASMLGLEHEHIHSTEPLSFDDIEQAFQYTDGEYDLVDYARILRVHRALSERFDISINGSFGEVARGYWWELLWPSAGRRGPMDAGKVARLRYAAQPFDSSLYGDEIRLDLTSHFTGVFERTNAGLSDLPNTMQMDHAYLRMRMQRWQGRIGSSTDQLWPCLPPFLFRSVMETMLQSPTALRRRSLLIRRMLARFTPDLANYPLEHGEPALPLTLSNSYRFAPLLGFYGGKVVSRLKGKFHLADATAAGNSPPPLRLQLWQHEKVRDLLEHPSKSGRLLEADRLKAFLKRSQNPTFAFNDQWYRLLTLEYTIRLLDETGYR